MYRVLFAEDEAVMRMAFSKMMSWDDTGFQLASVVANGAEALSYIEKNKVDILITDLKMPVMDGLELIEALKKRSFRGVILVLSNYTDFELVRKALTRGAADYILKLNIDGETLLKQLRAAAVILESGEAGIPRQKEDPPAPADFFDPVRQPARSPGDASFARYKKEVRDALLFIHFHFAEKITLDDVAKAVNLNRNYLCRLFKQETGGSMFAYLNDLRMQKAAALIEAGDTYMRGVAAAVGIDDQFYFTRIFKKYHKVPPSKYGKLREKA